ncbi:hypothetical protein ACS0TY_035080 [Phlomoides rotata]
MQHRGSKGELSDEQVNVLENSFVSEQKPASERLEKLAVDLGVDLRRVEVWFQNRRDRRKSQKLEEENNKLESQVDVVYAPLIERFHIFLANIYATANRWEDSTRVRRKMKTLGTKKLQGSSTLENQ